MKRAELHAEMVGNAREAIQVLKQRSNVAAVRREYLSALALFAPELHSGKEYAIAQELGVHSGERSDARTGKRRPRAFRRAMHIRASFEQQRKAAAQPFKIGDTILCRGEQALLHSINSDGGCTVAFGTGVAEKCVDYASMTREPKASGRPTRQPCARLEHIPPSLSPQDRQKRCDATSDEVKKAVQETYYVHCATSPHQRDSVSRRLSRYVVEKAQALILTSTFQELYELFCKANETMKLSYAVFKRLAPWHLKRAYRETCVCRCCELFRLYAEGCNTVAEVLAPLIPSTDECDADDIDIVDDADEESGEQATSDPAPVAELARLVAFCKLTSKSKMAEKLICSGDLQKADMECLQNKCRACGLKQFWSGSTGMRPKLVDGAGKLKQGISPVWQSTMKWETLKSGKSTPSDGSAADEKDGLRERKEGTLIQFLDDFQAVSMKFPAHKYLVADVRRATTQRDQNFWPGMLLANYDWSENGTILNAIQIQSEYWSLVHYSLFICITSYLEIDAWCSRSSLLPIGTEVTVELEGGSVPNQLQPAAGSYFAIVRQCPTDQGGDHNLNGTYWVQSPGSDHIIPIPRERLRHRKRRTTAFVCITDEKRHDAVTTQHMLNKQFEYWKEQQDPDNPFWAWVGHSDNASHFKSGSMMNFWSRVRSEGWLKSVWVEFGCPGHGKGPWDGMGAVIKQQLTRDLTNGKILTDDGYVT